MEQFKSWRDIKQWALDNGYNLMANRLQLNNDCWNSSGEFGRSQAAICDAMRFAVSEKDRHEIANDIEETLKNDELVEIGIQFKKYDTMLANNNDNGVK